MILRTIKCSVINCHNEQKEAGFNQGFPGWGDIHGLLDTDTGETTAHLCPFHLAIVKQLLMGAFDKVFMPTKDQVAQFGGKQ